jgi:hypothetical protein
MEFQVLCNTKSGLRKMCYVNVSDVRDCGSSVTMYHQTVPLQRHF